MRRHWAMWIEKRERESEQRKSESEQDESKSDCGLKRRRKSLMKPGVSGDLQPMEEPRVAAAPVATVVMEEAVGPLILDLVVDLVEV